MIFTRPALWFGSLLLASACGAALPKRFVLEQAIDGWAFRRYQEVLDVEFTIPDRSASGHTATYVRRSQASEPEQRATVPFGTAFVSVYSKAPGLSAEVSAQLALLQSYDVEPKEISGDWVLALDSADPYDAWILWVSGPYVVKIGGHPEAKEPIASAYLDRYPSDLSEHGRARDGTASSGLSERAQRSNAGLAVPRHLRDGASTQ